ncbi:hypothetical protein ACJ41O_012755 [Fusarium nematophilum]
MKFISVLSALLSVAALAYAAPADNDLTEEEKAKLIQDTLNERIHALEEERKVNVLSTRDCPGCGDNNKCPGGQDFNFCIPWQSQWVCSQPISDPGGFPIPGGSCNAHVTKLCACWCNCNKNHCDDASLDMPDYC